MIDLSKDSSFPMLSDRYDRTITKFSVFCRPDAWFLCGTSPIDTWPKKPDLNPVTGNPWTKPLSWRKQLS